ncbi:MAG: hypothetical protein QG597_4816 [Actinomycetota bacterium]|nr:hypothetical protein [Actinomycetota bacterium]
MSYTWRYEHVDGSVIVNLPASATGEQFPSQSDAENWIGENWRDLLSDGVDAVTLLAEDAVVYGPMSLHPAT